ncbi:MAG: hypothetical protein ACLTAS_15080 [Butyribacter sp.]
MIVGKDVCKSFEGFKALDNASFHVRKGSVYGLVGPNGAGRIYTYQTHNGSV